MEKINKLKYDINCKYNIKGFHILQRMINYDLFYDKFDKSDDYVKQFCEKGYIAIENIFSEKEFQKILKESQNKKRF